MKIFHGYRDAHKKLHDPVAAIGIFDGIHAGHKKVVGNVLDGKHAGRDRVIITFDPHPRTVLNGGKGALRIMSLEHRLHIFEKMGIDAVVIIHFSRFIAEMTPEDFIKHIVKQIGARTVYVGSNFHFGHGKSGNVSDFRRIGKLHGVEVSSVPPVRKGGRIISSTWIRELVALSRMEEAAKLLKRPVSVLGTVVRGDERGRRLGIPTANIDPHHEVIPPPGVYAVKVDIAGRLHDGVLNIGFRPTFYGRKSHRRKEPHIEVNISGDIGDLYGLFIEIFFVKKLRDEIHFRNENLLIEQISRDKKRAEKILLSPSIASNIKRYKYL